MRLIDCFTEVMAFTINFLKKASAEQPPGESVVRNYEELIARSSEQRLRGRFSEADWKEAFFAVCCWVDESILCSEWPEKGKWSGHQLQQRYFNTANGGDEFFTHLNGLGQGDREVREVYGACLALGFKGRFFDAEHQRALSDLARANFDLVQAGSGLGEHLFLFPLAYGVQHSRRKRSFGIYVVMFFAALLPVVCFTALYYFYGQVLNRIVFQYFH